MSNKIIDLGFFICFIRRIFKVIIELIIYSKFLSGGEFMVFNTECSIALKNNLGQYYLKSFSIFEIDKIICELPSLEVIWSKKCDIYFKIKCPICGEDHYYKYNINEFMRREVVIGGCEITGIPIFYIGRDKNVYERVNRFNDMAKKISSII